MTGGRPRARGSGSPHTAPGTDQPCAETRVSRGERTQCHRALGAGAEGAAPGDRLRFGDVSPGRRLSPCPRPACYARPDQAFCKPSPPARPAGRPLHWASESLSQGQEPTPSRASLGHCVMASWSEKQPFSCHRNRMARSPRSNAAARAETQSPRDEATARRLRTAREEPRPRPRAGPRCSARAQRSGCSTGGFADQVTDPPGPLPALTVRGPRPCRGLLGPSVGGPRTAGRDVWHCTPNPSGRQPGTPSAWGFSDTYDRRLDLAKLVTRSPGR